MAKPLFLCLVQIESKASRLISICTKPRKSVSPKFLFFVGQIKSKRKWLPMCRALPFPKLTLAWDSQANRVFSLGEILPSSKPRQPGEKPRKASCKSAWGGAWGARRALGRRHDGDVAACRRGTFHAIQWPLCRQLNKAWLASVQAARPGLTQRAQAKLARRTQQHRNSSSCNSESGFSDVLVICRGGSNMILSAENLFVH